MKKNLLVNSLPNAIPVMCICALLFIDCSAGLNMLFIPGAKELSLSSIEATKTWDGDAGDGLWLTPANWSDDTVPVDGDIIDISNGDTVATDGIEFLPAGCTIYISGGSALNQASLEVRLNGCTLNVASDGALYGDFWDMNGATINFESGATVDIDDWENKGINSFNFEMGPTGFTPLVARILRIKFDIANAAYTVDMSHYVGGPQEIVLVDYDFNPDGVTAASFQTATLEVLNESSVSCNLEFDEVNYDIVLVCE